MAKPSKVGEEGQTLCETVVTRTTALRTLRTFLTPQFPEPPGARVLGCILQLAESEENARFWWQYAAGAGDPAASYCLYLHHRALGEHAPARWWHEQTELLQNTPSTDEPIPPGEGPGAEPDAVPFAVTAALNAVSTTDASLLPTALRILGVGLGDACPWSVVAHHGEQDAVDTQALVLGKERWEVCFDAQCAAEPDAAHLFRECENVSVGADLR
ncbi:hypothetical protein ACFVIZ_16810 [Streptomyces anulatus]|uniref:hypothetical protein n=1 Tax=Streptomyces anulatus TaxID=1892 RepID=UPI00362C9179